jgi:hypothetical protein
MSLQNMDQCPMTGQVSFGMMVSNDENNELHVYTAGLAPPPLISEHLRLNAATVGLTPIQ